MATVNLGRIKFVNRGTYNNGTAYAADDVVIFTDTVGGLQNTSAYIATASTTGNAPASGGTVHGSWQVLAQGAPDRLPSQSGQSGKFLTTNGSALSFGAVTQVIKKIHTFHFLTRTSGSSNSNHNQFMWTNSFTPLDTSNSFYFNGQVPVNHAGNDYCGFGLRIEKNGGGGTTDLNADGVIYAASNNGNMGLYGYQVSYSGGFSGSGVYTIYHRTFGSSSHPDNFCPNSSDDSRLTSQTSGDLQIIEYANA